MFELVKKLTGAFGVSGNEENIRDVIITEIKPVVDDIIVDVMGNLIAVKRGTGKKIMLAAHMDEIGIIVTYIDDRGYIRFSNVGGVSPFIALGQRVRFKNGVTGVIYYEEKLESMKDLKIPRLFIDIGVKTREEAEKRIHIGDVAAFVGEAILQNGRIVSKALDDRAGCAVLISTAKSQPRTDNEIYYVFTTQEELGTRGAKTAAYVIKPDAAIAIDVTVTGDIPECGFSEVKLGGGPANKIKDRSVITHPEIRSMIYKASEKLGIKVQDEIMDIGGTDAGAIHLEAGGIPSGGVSIPCRYTHSPAEIIDLEDLEKAAEVLKCFVEDFKGL